MKTTALRVHPSPRRTPSALLAAALLGAFALPAWSDTEETTPAEEEADAWTWEAFEEAVVGGRFWLKLRYRAEFVDDASKFNTAEASTLRTVLGYETAPFHGVTGLLEFEGVNSVFRSMPYNPDPGATSNYPLVADPEGAEMNQAYLKYAGLEDATIAGGRQRITLDNHRHVGNVGWRQNEQTFDAVSATWSGVENLEAFYAYIGNVNRIFGDDLPAGDAPMNSHLVNLGYEIPDVGRLTGYLYHLDYARANNYADSTLTVGARLAGQHSFDGFDLKYAAEFANQTDAGDNTNQLDEEYLHGELAGTVSGVTLTVGAEVLGGSGATGDQFRTPLATGHKFNGWADMFLGTPGNGLQDFYVGASGSVGKAKLGAVWHDFTSETESHDWGTELDLVASYPVHDGISVGIKHANYEADEWKADTTKTWLWVSFAK